MERALTDRFLEKPRSTAVGDPSTALVGTGEGKIERSALAALSASREHVATVLSTGSHPDFVSLWGTRWSISEDGSVVSFDTDADDLWDASAYAPVVGLHSAEASNLWKNHQYSSVISVDTTTSAFDNSMWPSSCASGGVTVAHLTTNYDAALQAWTRGLSTSAVSYLYRDLREIESAGDAAYAAYLWQLLRDSTARSWKRLWAMRAWRALVFGTGVRRVARFVYIARRTRLRAPRAAKFDDPARLVLIQLRTVIATTGPPLATRHHRWWSRGERVGALAA